MKKNKLYDSIVSSPEFWDERYRNNETGWDIGGPTPVFKEWIDTQLAKKSICILGAGNGWDAVYFAKLGHKVTAVDFSFEAIKNIKALASENNVILTTLEEDIFNLDNSFSNMFDVVLEYTCFCAIDPDNRNKYISVVNAILKPDGLFVALLFPLLKDYYNSGPPFHVDLNKTIKLFNKYFKIIDKIKPKLSIASRIDKEVLAIMRKNGK